MADPIELLNEEQYQYSTSLQDKTYTDFHSKVSIVFGSLLKSGYDWGRDEWTSYSMDPAVLSAIRTRINNKIEQEFFFDELGTLPVKRFSMRMLSKMNEIMAKLGPVYQAIAEGVILTTKGTDEKVSREVLSDYPQSMLDPEAQDYASSATEMAEEQTGKISLLELFERIPAFNEPDQQVLEHVSDCFSKIYSFNI